MTDTTTRTEAIESIQTDLLAWREDGLADPKLTVYDEDGTARVWHLDADDQPVIIPGGVPIEQTVSVSEGGGVETNREPVE